METKVSVPYLETETADTVRMAAEIQIKSCTEYLASFKARKKPHTGESIKKLRALLQRAKANTIMGDKVAARADIAEMRQLAEAAKLRHKLSQKYGAGLILLTMEAMNADQPREQFSALVDQFPYYEPIHQMALSYAIEAKDYKAAARYVTLPDMLNENAVMSQLKGYLLEMAGERDKALEHYRQSAPSLETYIRPAHLLLYQGDIAASREAYEKALALGKAAPRTSSQRDLLAFLRKTTDDRGRTMTPLYKKRLEILETVFGLDSKSPEAVYQDLLKKGSRFGHFELVSALQYVGGLLEHKPTKVFDLDAKPRLSKNLNATKLRNNWLAKLPKRIPKGKRLQTVYPTYSSSIPLLTSKGFSNETLEDGAIEVTFDGSVKTDRSTITELTLLRAAQVTLKKDKRFFRVRDLNHYSKVMTYNYSVTGETVGYKVKMVIETSDTQKSVEKDFDAEVVKAALLPKYTKKR